MKKKYVKPELYFESFELSASIAAGCKHITGHQMDMCAYEVGGRSVFVDNVSSCTTKTPDGSWESLCYHNPEEANKLFASI